MLLKSGVQDPHKFASKEDLAAVVQGYNELEFSADAVECVKKLQQAGITVWGFTMADPKKVAGFFANAGIEMEGRVLGCDSSGVGKPDPEAYKPVFRRIKNEGCDPWFGAAHQWVDTHMYSLLATLLIRVRWDAAAARSVGWVFRSLDEFEALLISPRFRSAFCTAWEGEFVDVVGKVDIVADTLSEMADKVIAASQ